jgi:hypothetical protein
MTELPNTALRRTSPRFACLAEKGPAAFSRGPRSDREVDRCFPNSPVGTRDVSPAIHCWE